MKRLKKWLTCLMSLAFVLLAAQQWTLRVSAAQIVDSGTLGNVTWSIDAEGTLLISGTGNIPDSSHATPWSRDSRVKTAKVTVKGMTNASGLFSGCENLTYIDLKEFDSSQVTDMSDMFRGCQRLTSIDLSGLNTSHVKDMSHMFSSCFGLKSLDLSSFDTSNVIKMGGMFQDCSSLESVDVSSFNTSQVLDMSWMFEACVQLKGVDVSSFDTSNVTKMAWMFANCFKITSLDLRNFDTSKVLDMSSMFFDCTKLESLDLSSFDISSVTAMDKMFEECRALTSLDLSSFDMSYISSSGQNTPETRLSMIAYMNQLSTIRTPRNLNMRVSLWSSGWQLPDGTEITELPKNLSESITITRKLPSTTGNNSGNQSGSTGNTGNTNGGQTNNGQNGAGNGAGNTTDSSIYGTRVLTVNPTAFNTIQLSWNAVPGAKSYEIYYSTSPTGGFKRLANVKKTSYKFSKAKCGVTYYFQMRVCEKKTKSEFGPVSYGRTELTGTPTLQVKKTTYNSVALKWSKVAGAKKYEIFYADSLGGEWKSLGIKSGTSFTHKKLVTGATYYYQVRPIRDSFQGSWSNGVSATTILADVSRLKATAAGTDRMKLSWKKVSGASQYVILRSDRVDGDYQVIGYSGKASYVDTGLQSGKTYFYKVYAVSGPYRTKETEPVGQTTKMAK